MRFLLRIGLILGVVTSAGCVGICEFEPRKHSPQFNGTNFENPEPTGKGFGDFIRWQMTSSKGYWPDWIDDSPGSEPADRVNGETVNVTWINHSTVLIQTEELNILTDPVWSYRIGPWNIVGPTRHRPPGLAFSDLPPIDVVLISHNHYDHMDLPTLRRLQKNHEPRFFVPLGNKAFLQNQGLDRVTALDWWESSSAGGQQVTAVPARHFSGRGVSDVKKALWSGFVVSTGQGPLYFAGDTGWGGHFREIRDRFGPVQLALIPIGAYVPRWFMKAHHINPAEAVRAHDILGAHRSLAIHWGTFAQADDGYIEPVLDLREALYETSKVTHREFWVLPEGETRRLTSN
jgi:L-ascorbate metabolism protein UlaG (beta-lactamase superfamily)